MKPERGAGAEREAAAQRRAFLYHELDATLTRAIRQQPTITFDDAAAVLGLVAYGLISVTRAASPEMQPADMTAALAHRFLGELSDMAIECVSQEVAEESAEISAAEALRSPSALSVADGVLRKLGIGLTKKGG